MLELIKKNVNNKMAFTEKGQQYIDQLIKEISTYCVDQHGTFKNDHELYSVLNFELMELCDANSLLIQAFNDFTLGMRQHDEPKRREAKAQMETILKNYFLELFQIAGVIKKSYKPKEAEK